MEIINSHKPSLTATLRVLSTTRYVIDWMNSTDQARILHVFEPACNLINSKGEVISLVSPQIGNGPFNAVIPAINFKDYLDEHSTVRIDNTSIYLCKLNISFPELSLWQPIPEWSSQRTKSRYLDFALSPIEDLLAKESSADSFARIVLPKLTCHEIPAAIFQVVQNTFAEMKAMILNNRLDDIAETAGRLGGLGGGLTPAGDDFLMGFMHGLWALLPSSRAEALSGQIAAAAIPKTTSLSAAWLWASARGEAGESWHKLLTAIMNDYLDTVIKSARQILSTGHSSGADALGGFVFAVKNMAR